MADLPELTERRWNQGKRRKRTDHSASSLNSFLEQGGPQRAGFAHWGAGWTRCRQTRLPPACSFAGVLLLSCGPKTETVVASVWE